MDFPVLINLRKDLKNALIASLFIFMFVISGCGDDSPTQETNGQNLLLLGQFHEWTYSDTLQLSMTDRDGTNPEYFLISTKIDSKGSFSLKVPAPPSEKLTPINEIYDYGFYSSSNITFSDSSAKFFRGYLVIMKESLYYGAAEWTDYASVDQTAPEWKYYKAAYYYFDKDVEIKGSAVCPSCRGGIIEFEFSAKPGWNVLLFGLNQNLVFSYENYKPVNGKYDYGMVEYITIPPYIKDSLNIVVPLD